MPVKIKRISGEPTNLFEISFSNGHRYREEQHGLWLKMVGDPDEDEVNDPFFWKEIDNSKLERKLNRLTNEWQQKNGRPKTRKQPILVKAKGKGKRSGHGIKIFSSVDPRYFFEFGCWRSKKYPGHFSLRFGFMKGFRALVVSRESIATYILYLARKLSQSDVEMLARKLEADAQFKKMAKTAGAL